MKPRSTGRGLLAILVVCGLASMAPQCFVRVDDPSDPIVDRDPLSPDTMRAGEIPTGTPWIEPGPDGELDSEDDVVSRVVGDTDLVVRSGVSGAHAAIPATSPLRNGGSIPDGIAGPLGRGTPIDFIVMGSDGNLGPGDLYQRIPQGGGIYRVPPLGQPASPDYFPGLPFLIIAFADLDADGFVGITGLDGDPTDALIEEAELIPVGRRVALGESWGASGSIQVSAGGPPTAPIRVALTAATYAGAPRPGYFGGNVPDGAAIMTRMPFLPRTDPDKVIEAGPGGPNPADPDSLAAVEIEPAVVPDINHPIIGEAFTLRLDGSDRSIDIARMTSGAFSRFGWVQAPDPLRFRAHPMRPVRPGIDPSGVPAPYEVLQQLALPDDGGVSSSTLRIVALDELGNICDPPAAASVELRASGPISIVSPDSDADPAFESLSIADVRGVEIVIDDAGGALDDPGSASLFLEGAGGMALLEIALADPDVDDSGLVDSTDLDLVEDARGLDLGEEGYDPLLDLDGDGRIHDDDADLVEAAIGQAVAIP